ncbi:MAG TPA: LacI family DNA-binding transcriptional regulator [Roseiflexaceae bacterium]|nr:LacI family DNA-binding transcriptional regulator [Roseiflexaceae bacterium]
MATIREVAQHAKVSVATVSHVINRTRYVDPETEERVRAAIKALEYRPNLLARSLRRRETRTIGLIVPDNANPYFAEVAHVIESTGFAVGYSLILCNTDWSEEKQSIYVDVLLSKQVDGLILMASSERLEPLAHILAAHVPVVIVGREMGDMPVSQVQVDNEQGGYLAGQYLVRLGHRRIGCVAGPGNETPSWGRIVGFRRALEEAGVPLAPELIVPGDFRPAGGEAAMRTLLERDRGLTAVFAANDLMAFGAINALRRADLHVPQDVSVIGFDNIGLSAVMMPALTTVAQPVAEVGQVSVQLLLQQIGGERNTPARVVLPTALIERESCRMLP